LRRRMARKSANMHFIDDGFFIATADGIVAFPVIPPLPLS
jgi:hypothetical protein